MSQRKIEQLANGEHGIVQKLSQEVKNKIDIKHEKEENQILNLEGQPNKNLETRNFRRSFQNSNMQCFQ